MNTHYEDWADWAGDNSQQAEADLRAEREKAEASIRKGLLQSAAGETADLGDFTQYADDCEHTEVYSTGHCADCGVPIEGFEPTDAQIPGTYEIGRSAA